MAGAEASGRWYVRARGRVLGPLSWAQLRSLRDRGQLARFHQVSQDRHTWVGADSLAGLFSQTEAGRLPRSTVSARTTDLPEFLVVDDPGDHSGSTRPATGEAPEWYYARDGTRQGPVPLSELQRLAARGVIGSDTLVWKSGMEDWTPGFLVPELDFLAPEAAAVAGPGPSTAPSRRAPSPTDLSPRTSPLAFAGLVLGLLWLCGIGSLAAIVVSALALRQIDKARGTLSGKGLAVAGLVLGIAGVILTLFAAVFARFFWSPSL
ncbi:MAG TPA: GYF domain-containing protein [Isosphaeraceae bacterium]|nr:GYF domain-containing protein [Isosphaeraceae bacterium]